MKSRDRTSYPPAAAAVGLAVALSPALTLAQDATQKAESAQPADQVVTVATAAKPSGLRVVRTGSNILRYRTEESLPLLEIDRPYIDRTGATTTPELLRTIPQIQVGR